MSFSTVTSADQHIDCEQQDGVSLDEMLGESELAMASAIGRALRARRLSLGLSLTVVAERALKRRDMSHRVSALESGDSSGNISTLLKVFSALGMGAQVTHHFSEIASRAASDDLVPVPRHLRALGLKTALDELVEKNPSIRYSMRELAEILGNKFRLDLRDESIRRHFAERVHRSYFDAIERHKSRQQHITGGEK